MTETNVYRRYKGLDERTHCELKSLIARAALKKLLTFFSLVLASSWITETVKKKTQDGASYVIESVHVLLNHIICKCTWKWNYGESPG